MAIGGPYVCRYFCFALVIGLEGGGLGMKQTLPFCPQFLPQIPKMGSSPEELSLSAQMLAGVWRSGVSAVFPHCLLAFFLCSTGFCSAAETHKSFLKAFKIMRVLLNRLTVAFMYSLHNLY